MQISNRPLSPAHRTFEANRVHESRAATPSGLPSQTGILIVNADDWGRDLETTERIVECVTVGAVSSASAMVFMEDSERAADRAGERGVDVGLHLNFTTPFSAQAVPRRLLESHERVARYLKRSRLSQVVYHPGLADAFKYVVAAQLEEFARIYGTPPRRVDGHHHMHLCANVLWAGLLPSGTIARRNFSFQPGEKSGVNRFYRGAVDRILAKRHRLADFFFSLPPFEPPERLDRIFTLAGHAVVEAETHPVNPEEYKFLTRGEIFQRASHVTIAAGYSMPNSKSSSAPC